MMPGLGKLGTVRMDAAILSNRGSLNAAMSAALALCTEINGRRDCGNGLKQAGDLGFLMELPLGCGNDDCIARRTPCSIGTYSRC